MKLTRIRSIKKYSLIIVSVLFTVLPFVLARNNPAFRTVKGVVIYFLEIFNLLIIFWLFYLISDIDLFVQGKVGKSLSFIVFGLIIFAIQSTFVCMASLQIPFFANIGVFLIQPIVLSIIRTIVLMFLITGIVSLVKLYKE